MTEFGMEECHGQTKKRSACAELIDGLDAGLCSYSHCNANDQWRDKMRKSGDGHEFRGEIERDAHQGSNIADELSTRAPQEGVGEKEGADEGSRKREHSTVDEDRENALDDASESGKITQDRRRQPPLGVIRTLCREAAECRFLHRSKGSPLKA